MTSVRGRYRVLLFLLATTLLVGVVGIVGGASPKFAIAAGLVLGSGQAVVEFFMSRVMRWTTHEW